jgi:hypothetical protein
MSAPSKNYVHIYTAKGQPATRYVDDYSGKRMIFRRPPKSLLWCHSCYQRRRAENCVVQVYYDCVQVWCAPGRGCKSEREIRKKQLRAFRNRSAGQRKRLR